MSLMSSLCKIDNADNYHLFLNDVERNRTLELVLSRSLLFDIQTLFSKRRSNRHKLKRHRLVFVKKDKANIS